MVTEIAIFDVVTGSEASFIRAYHQARELVAQTVGCRTMRMTRGVETPDRFVLLVEWDSIADHEAFRASDRFGEWRGLIGPYFRRPPTVEHFEEV